MIKPILVENMNDIGGVAEENTLKGEKCKMILRSIISSNDKCFNNISRNMIKVLMPSAFVLESINFLLIIRHNNGQGEIYINNMPFILEMRSKKSINAGELVTEKDVIDISGFHFKDVKFELYDKVIFIFRKNWKFGMFFDFTQDLDVNQMEKDIAFLYNELAYEDLYNSFQNLEINQLMLEDGWFPFMALLPKKYETLTSFYSEETQKREKFVDSFLDYYSKDEVNKMCENWYTKEIFLKKKEIIDSGIEAYFQGNTHGYILSIKTLYSEIDGLLRKEYHKENQTNNGNRNWIKFSDLEDYVLEKGLEKFSSGNSLGFPEKFYSYLTDVFFKNFDMNSVDIDISRHTSIHGVASSEAYTRARAFQGVLILDQLYYYL